MSQHSEQTAARAAAGYWARAGLAALLVAASALWQLPSLPLARAQFLRSFTGHTSNVYQIGVENGILYSASRDTTVRWVSVQGRRVSSVACPPPPSWAGFRVPPPAPQPRTLLADFGT